MAQFLLTFAVILISMSLVTAGRFRFPLEPGSKLDNFFVHLQLVGNILAVVTAALLPIVTEYRGIPALSFIAAILVVAALAIYQVKLPSIWNTERTTAAKHSVDAESLVRTRWPYRTLFAVGYFVLLAYVFTVPRVPA
jgi:hypothetical protein